MNLVPTDCDALIVGSGVGGLIAGCYLAKAGLRVLIIEQTGKIGGYCGSFEKDGFTFDEAVHYVNHLGEGGILNKICLELGLNEALKIIPINPSDRLYMPDFQINIYRDLDKTIFELQKKVPEDQIGIEKFFREVEKFDFQALFLKYQDKSFQFLLDEYFKNTKLKTALGLFAATLGLSPKKLSALAGLGYYKGSILDGGYHLIGGAQTFSNEIGNCFRRSGGKILLSKKVEKILIENNSVAGVVLSDNSRINCRFVIANCDATQLFLKLIDSDNLTVDFINRIRNLKPSTSNFVVYLGINKPLNQIVQPCNNIWYYPFVDLNEKNLDITLDDHPEGFVHIALSSLHDRSIVPKGCESLVLFVGAAFLTEDYWAQNKKRFTEIMIQRAEHLIPGLSSAICVKLSASPQTMYRYTLNRDGAYRGWEITPDQTKLTLVPQQSSIEGLYLAGHWVTTPVGNGGVSMVAQSGKLAAKAVLRNLKGTILSQ